MSSGIPSSLIITQFEINGKIKVDLSFLKANKFQIEGLNVKNRPIKV